MYYGLRVIEYHKIYNNLFADLPDVRYYIVTGGRGSAKSFTVNTAGAALTLEKHQKILFTRYTLRSAGLSIIPEFIDKLERFNVTEAYKITKDSIINTATGSSVLFSGIKTSSGDQTANLKSLEGVTAWIIDEAEELTDEDTFDKINLSIRSTRAKNRVMLILNPTTKEHWIYKRFFEGRGVNPGFNGVVGDTCYIHTTYLQAKEHLSDTFLIEAEQMRLKRPEKYKHVIEGGWLDKAEGVILKNWEIGEFDNSLPFLFGMDFGYSIDPTTLIKIAVDEKRKRIYCSQKMYEAGLNTIQTFNKAVEFTGQKGFIIADSAEPRLIDELRHKGLNIKGATKGPDSIRAGIKRMEDYDIIVDQDSTELIKELNNYRWSDKKSATPIDNYNHCIDAIRYAFMHLKDKPTFGTYAIR